ncbi:MAG: DUF108 domain-containing protein [Candidatus Omnitrophica bacterium]|nr:DUF108 domain-containing protein [Candidatus Omnitrophota bacterium]MBD3269067.1 DUF108 domain-containing protein [Candidatus Omnitrophota bacterium]
MKKTRKKIGIVGCGAVGSGVALYIRKYLSSYAKVHSLSDLNEAAALRLRKEVSGRPSILEMEEMFKACDILIEAASVDAAKSILRKALFYKKDLIIVSVGALIEDFSLLENAIKKKVNIYIPSGAICGADGIGALSMGNIKKISLITSKPPRSLAGADYIQRRNIGIKGLKKERLIFKGKVSEAIKYFPRNINVAATLLLVSAFRNIEVCIKTNPELKRNTHRIIVKAQEANLNIEVENIPSKTNPKTSFLTILSVQHLLNKIFFPFKVGS